MRLLVHVEGETEEKFVNEILKNHLLKFGYDNISARLLGNARNRQKRGGIRHWPGIRSEIQRHLLQDKGAIATTMVDYYALPKSWPGRESTAPTTIQKASIIQKTLIQDFKDTIANNLDINRFIPFVMMHEFEGLLFSDCTGFSRGINEEKLTSKFQEIRNQFKTPEDINDSPETAPSKRILSILPNYQKPLLAVLAILEIGLDPIRKECPHFNSWIHQLEETPSKFKEILQ